MTQTLQPTQHHPPAVNPLRFRLARRRLAVLAAVVFLNPVSLYYYYLTGSALYGNLQNQAVLSRFSQPFFDTALPADTVEISRSSSVSYHGSQGCSFVAERVVESSLTQQQLQTAFAETGYPMPHGEPHFTDPEGLARIQVNAVEGTTNRYTLLLWPESNYVRAQYDAGCGLQ